MQISNLSNRTIPKFLWNQRHANACVLTQSAAERALLITCLLNRQQTAVDETFFRRTQRKNRLKFLRIKDGAGWKYSNKREVERSAISHMCARWMRIQRMLMGHPLLRLAATQSLPTRLFICSGQW
jgi:hypothetical protein